MMIIKIIGLIAFIAFGYRIMTEIISKGVSTGSRHRAKMEHDEVYRAAWIKSIRPPITRGDGDE